MKAYSMDLRERVIATYEKGDTTIRKVAETFQVSIPWVQSMVRLKRETHSLEPKGGRRGPPAKINEKKRQQLLRLLAATPDLTLKEMAKKLKVNVHPCTIWRTLAKMKFSLKKIPAGRGAGASGCAQAPPGIPDRSENVEPQAAGFHR